MPLSNIDSSVLAKLLLKLVVIVAASVAIAVEIYNEHMRLRPMMNGQMTGVFEIFVMAAAGLVSAYVISKDTQQMTSALHKWGAIIGGGCLSTLLVFFLSLGWLTRMYGS